MNKQPKVAVSILTYNHEKFVAQNIESVLGQQTDFQTKLFISDDSSIDNTVAICNSYKKRFPEKICFNSNKRNIGTVQNWVRNIEKCIDSGAKYIALCDGDDCWIHPDKLQMQVNFLDENEEYGLVYGDIELVDKTGKKVDSNEHYDKLKTKYRSGWVFSNLWKFCFINTNTVVIRTDAIKPIISDQKNPVMLKWFIYDYWLWLKLAKRVKFKFINEKLAAYRLHEHSISKITDYFRYRALLVKLDIIKSFDKQYRNNKIKKLFARSLLGMLFSKRMKLGSKLKVLPILFKYPPLPWVMIKN